MNLGTSLFSFPMPRDPVVPIAQQIAAHEERAARLPRLKQEVAGLREKLEALDFKLSMGLITEAEYESKQSSMRELIEAIAFDLTGAARQS